ncbi:MAG: hypothetical protein ABSA42_15760, partial [Terracidiphilus sp.]
PLRVLAEPIAKPISSRLMALPAGFAPPPAIKSIPCEKWRLERFHNLHAVFGPEKGAFFLSTKSL